MKEIWLQSQATVLGCKNDFPITSALTFGLRPRRKFRVAYQFTVEDKVYSGEFLSAKELPNEQLIPVRFSSGNPEQNNLALQNIPDKMPVMTMILALLFLAAIARFLIVHYHR